MGILSGDGGEIATMAIKGGLTHPPGYNIILWLFNISGNIAKSAGFYYAVGMAILNILLLKLTMQSYMKCQ